MKVLLLGFAKISYMPYMNFYLDELKKYDCDISVLYWDRDGKKDSDLPDGIKKYKFLSYMEDSLPLRCKILKFIKYRRYAMKVIKNNKFDLLVVLHSTPGIVLYDVLRKRYRNKFILDYRDFTYENFKCYKYLIHKLVSSSIATFISSEAYRKFLPKSDKIFNSHNIILESLENREVRRLEPREHQPIRIRFWGLLRYLELNMRLVDALGNDERFELHYHGREQDTAKKLKLYCQERGFQNIYFHGAYQPDERYEFASETDILHNIYENDKIMKNAMANKYYDGLIFYLPQICNQNSLMGQKIVKNKIGIAINSESTNLGDEIYEYYKSINWFDFEMNCNRTLEDIMKQYRMGMDIMQQIITKQKV